MEADAPAIDDASLISQIQSTGRGNEHEAYRSMGYLNSPGMNVLMLALMLIGGTSLWNMRREVFPAFELEIVMITVPYPGATPQDSEEAICQKIEESIRAIDGIK